MPKYTVGQKITISKGRAGERPDFYPAQIVSMPELERINGRLTRVADVVYATTTQAGVERLAADLQDLGFAFPVRVAGMEHVEILDGPKDAPLTVNEIVAKQAQQAIDFLLSRPASADSIDLADLADATE